MREAGEVVRSGARSYVIEGVHARGGFATTYRARDEATGRAVAFKEIGIGDLDGWKTFELFEREALALKRVDHPRMPRFEDAFICQGDRAVERDAATGAVSFVLVQEFVEGTSLAKRLKEHGPLLGAEVQNLFSSLLDLVDYLHGLAPPIIHRDIKPSNIILGELDEPYLVDFGAVRDALRTADDSAGSTVAGTLGYMPPEQAMGSARPASDLYALAMTVLVAATGKDPTALSVDEGVGKVRVPRELFSAPTARALESMLEPAVGKRVQRVAEVRKLLAAAPGVSRTLVAGAILGALLIGGGAGLQLTASSTDASAAPRSPAPSERGWFARVRPHCNPVEVDMALRQSPPGPRLEDQSDAAACLAIAGKIDRARMIIGDLPARDRPEAANRLFNLVHPIADQGDDASTGPIMRFVLDYTPDNYMALYHAGVAEYALGDPANAKTHLTRFLELYRQNDGWVKSARRVLDEMESEAPVKCGEPIVKDPEGKAIRAPACK